MSASPVGPVAVLFGGASPEHLVSLKSGATILGGLAATGVETLPVLIARDRSWSITPSTIFEDSGERGFDVAPKRATYVGDALRCATRLKELGVSAAVVGLHGGDGEDGVLQGFLTLAGIPFTGPGHAACALAMDKLLLKRVLKAEGVPTAEWIAFEPDVYAADPADALEKAAAFAERFGYPVVVKARALGSSVGVAIALRREDLAKSLAEASTGDGGLFVERGLKGPEVSCATFGRGAAAFAMPSIEIVPKKAAWFDYESKYAPGGSIERVPAMIAPEAEARVRETALRVHRLIGASSVVRTDMIIEDGTPYVLETNALPGMTPMSLVPQEAAAIGWSFPELLRRLVGEAIACARPT